MTTYSLPTPKLAVSRSNFLPVAAILASAILAMGYAGPVSADPLSADTKTNATVNSTPSERTLPAQAAGEDTMARCQQLFGLLSRHNSDGYARPLEARMAMEDCQKGNYRLGRRDIEARSWRARRSLFRRRTRRLPRRRLPPSSLVARSGTNRSRRLICGRAAYSLPRADLGLRGASRFSQDLPRNSGAGPWSATSRTPWRRHHPSASRVHCHSAGRSGGTARRPVRS